MTTEHHDPLSRAVLAALQHLQVERGAAAAGRRLAALDSAAPQPEPRAR